MKILVGVWHPAHVHFFKNFIWEMEKRGHSIKILALEKEMNIQILDNYQFEYEVIGKNRTGLVNKLFHTIINDIKTYKIVKDFDPDIMLGIAAIFFAHVGCVTKRPSIIFTDSEPSDLINNITFPFAGVICTPSCYLKELGDKQVRYDGYHEIAYLHPDYFIPDPSILDQFGTEGKEKNIVLRFISWGASHDIGLAGLKEATNIIDTLESYGNIRITSERKLPPRFEKYRIAIPPEKIHSLLYYSDLYMGEGGTMAVESALLGTPAIHIEGNSEGVAMGNFSGNFLDLRDNYGLLDFYPDQEQALRKAVEILEDEKSKGEWMQKRKKLFNDKIDVTKWMVDFVEQYPESLRGI